MKRPSALAAVDKIEEKRKPDDFIGHRNRESEGALPVADEATERIGCGHELARRRWRSQGQAQCVPGSVADAADLSARKIPLTPNGRQMTKAFAPRKMPGTATGKASFACNEMRLRRVKLPRWGSYGIAAR